MVAVTGHFTFLSHNGQNQPKTQITDFYQVTQKNVCYLHGLEPY
jgi:hypothetical protein